jgi:hypothetical protein
MKLRKNCDAPAAYILMIIRLSASRAYRHKTGEALASMVGGVMIINLLLAIR